MNALRDIPALYGGLPVFPQGPPPWPPPDRDVLQALESAFGDGSWGRYVGGAVERLESAIAAQCHVQHAVLCGSGTFAVELALRAVGVGPGDEVVMSAYDYPGNFLSIHALGAMPVLVDAAADHGNLDVAGLDQAIGTRTRAVLVSHLHGGIVPMDAVNELARARGVPVVEDVAQCPGATYHGRPLGSWGDVAVLSFGGSKLLTAGRGGAIITNRPDICQRARTFQNRGNLYCPISELQAAVLLPQLAKLDDRNVHRARQVILLRQLIDDLPGFRPFINQEIDCHPAYYKVGFHFDESSAGMSRSEMVQAAQAEGISLDAGFRALHVGRAPNRYRAPDDLPHATRMHAATLVLHHPVLLACPATMEELAAGLRKIINYHQEKRS